MTDQMKSVLTIYSSILGGFYAKTKEFEAAMMRARSDVGDDVWKRGFSGAQEFGATAAAQKHTRAMGVAAVNVAGNLVGVAYVENKDGQGNLYPKLRVAVECVDHHILLSIDIKDDVAQRLLSKLSNCSPAQFITISAWPTPVERNGRTFINHAVSVKDDGRVEVPANTEFSAWVKKITEAVRSVLATAGIHDEKTVATAKLTKRIDAHKQFLVRVSKKFEQTGPTTA